MRLPTARAALWCRPRPHTACSSTGRRLDGRRLAQQISSLLVEGQARGIDFLGASACIGTQEHNMHCEHIWRSMGPKGRGML